MTDTARETPKLLEDTHSFADRVVGSAALKLDAFSDPEAMVHAQTPLRVLLQQAFRYGYHKVLLPSEVGGNGVSGVDRQAFLEELGRGSAGFAMSLFLGGLPFKELASFGNKDLIAEFVAPFVNDRDANSIGCWAVTEPHHGSDALFVGGAEFRQSNFMSQETNGLVKGENYILNGEKGPWVSNGPLATHALVSFNIEPSRGGRELAFVPLEVPGVDRGKPIRKLGQRDLAQSSIIFREVEVHRELSLTVNEGYEPLLSRIQAEIHSALAAVASGLARAGFEEAVAHAHSRRQGGKPLSEHQTVRQLLFDLYTRVEAARALSRGIAQEPPDSQMTASLAAKIFCSETAFHVINDSMRIFGGVPDDHLIAKLFRDARVMWVEHGTNDTLRLVGAERIL